MKLLEKAGRIRDLKRQVPYLLTIKHQIIGKYIADFVYLENDQVVAEDFKGFDTPLSKWKREHFRLQYGFAVKVTHGR